MITIMKHRSIPLLNGRTTGARALVKDKIACASSSSNFWSSTENNPTNAWNVNFSSGNVGNNNKYNSNVARAVAALSEEERMGWIEAYYDCCRNKRSSSQCVDYAFYFYYKDILILAASVYDRSYRPSVSICFVVTRPKLREIFAANFRDRIVQHWVIIRLEPLFERRFVLQGNVSYNCRKGFGTLRAVDDLRRDIELLSAGYTQEAWIGRYDIRSFFMSIDKPTLLSLIIPFIEAEYQGEDKATLIWLVEVIVNARPADYCVKRSPQALFDALDPAKSSFFVSPDKSLQLGNITSQLFANFYMSFFDAVMLAACTKVGARYRRFVDDFTIVTHTKEDNLRLYAFAQSYLRDMLKLELHRDKFYLQECRHGVKFVGSVIMPGRIYLANRTVGSMIGLFTRLERLCADIAHSPIPDEQKLDRLAHLVASANAYLGFCRHNASYALRRRTMARLQYFWKVCYVQGKFQKIKIRDSYKLDKL